MLRREMTRAEQDVESEGLGLNMVEEFIYPTEDSRRSESIPALA